MNSAIAAYRLDNQRLTRPRGQQPAQLVAWMGAMQAQEYRSAKWAIAQRLGEGITDARIERAFNEGKILRTHVLRPTWHFVTPADIRWMLELTRPRVHQAMAYAYRVYELEPALRNRATAAIERALAEDECLTRPELAQELACRGITLQGVRLAILTMYAEVEGVICSGPLRRQLQTYALLSNRAARSTHFSRDEALAELTKRYFRSHGPATIRDFVWWSGLTTADARRGLEIVRAARETVDARTYWTLSRGIGRRGQRPSVHLLPIYDEYVVAYRDLDAVPRTGFTATLQPALVLNGEIAGSWKTASDAAGISVEITSHRRLRDAEHRLLDKTVTDYGRFLGSSVRIRSK